MLYRRMGLFAPVEDRETVAMLTEAGVLIPHQREKISGKQICSHCGDGFRYHYKRWIAGGCIEKGIDEAFFHTFSGNGEVLRFALDSPLSYDAFPDDWGTLKTMEIAEVLGWASEMGLEVTQHRLVHHWPCKAAMSREIDLLSSIILCAKGKTRIKHQIPGLKVGMEIFIDWSEDEYETPLIKKEALYAMLATDPRFTREYDAWLAHEAAVARLPVLCEVSTAQEVESIAK